MQRPGRVPDLGDTDVLIAGGGPAGLACAVELGLRRVACTVIEPRRTVAWDRPRAKTTSVRTMEHFRRWGLAERVREVAPLPVSWSSDAVFCTSLLGREITRIGDCFGMVNGRHAEFAEAGQQIPQPLVEQVLREAIADIDAITLITGSVVERLHEHGGGVEARVCDDTGQARSLRATFALGCDGARSVVREAVGARYQGASHDRPNFSVVFRAPGLAARVPHGRAIHYWIVDDEHPGLIGRMDLEDIWWAIAIGIDELTSSRATQRLLYELVGAEIDAQIISTDPWTAHMLLADRYQTERMLLVGDAAHLNPPWGGHGYNTAIGDAVNVGWKLAATLSGWAGPELLASYEGERRRVAEQTIVDAKANMGVPPSHFTSPLLDADGPRRRPGARVDREAHPA